jgi:L-rhamnose isomerase
MTLSEIVENLPANIVNKASDFFDVSINNIVASDLMSDVLVTDFDDALLVSSLASEQVVRTADIVGMRCILLVNDKIPLAAMKELAQDEDLTILTTPLSTFEACVSLGTILRINNLHLQKERV